MKNILVPTDFSDCALNAVKFAAELAKKTGATIHLAHIYQRVLTNSIDFEIEMYAKPIDQEQENFNEHMKELTQMDFLKGVKILCSMVSVYKLWDILVMDKYHDMDLIIMGSHGAGGLEEIFIGSNTQKFVQMAECPVIVLKDEIKLDNIKSIVFASDFREEVFSRYFTIKNFADRIGAKLHHVKVMTPVDYSIEEEEMEDIDEFVKKTGVKKDDIELYQSLDVEEGIIEYCKKIKANMIAIETHGRTGISHLFKDNIAEALANHSIVPVFSVKVTEKRAEFTDSVTEFLYKKNILFPKQNYYG